jgi:uncharacterized protein (TIGR01244 family)
LNLLNHIRNFLRIDDRLATSGMPQPGDFAAMRQAGFDVVINLALPTSDNALPNEGELVSAQGMSYVHIPVNFESPQPADFERFTKMMDVCAGQKVFVHCAANMRVSAFIFLHRLRHGADRTSAENDLKKIWQPDGVWREFLNTNLAANNQPPL